MINNQYLADKCQFEYIIDILVGCISRQKPGSRLCF